MWNLTANFQKNCLCHVNFANNQVLCDVTRWILQVPACVCLFPLKTRVCSRFLHIEICKKNIFFLRRVYKRAPAGSDFLAFYLTRKHRVRLKEVDWSGCQSKQKWRCEAFQSHFANSSFFSNCKILPDFVLSVSTNMAASLKGIDPWLKQYLKVNRLPDIYEVLVSS